MFKLVREDTTAEAAINEQHQWPVKFTATFTEDDSPAKIFVMQKASSDLVGDTFSCVASAIQMTDLPEDAPIEDGPFYRVNVITLLCRSAVAAEEAIEKIKEATQDLADNLTAAATLEVVEETIITPSNAP